jgi:hypothetical protein
VTARVYLDRSALFLRWGGRDAALVPDVGHAIEVFRSTGHEVVAVGVPPSDIPVDDILVADEPPGPEDPPAWFLTGERERCGTRRAGLRTVLVGGGPTPHSGRGRCDLEVPDLRSAVLAVIADEAMGA